MGKISIALSTYNGEKYILQLLDSIYHQTIKVDEILIIDDCSQDNTYTLIDSFIKDNKADNCVLKRNKTNEGWKKNFYKLFCECTGDYIFPCDQDDIWAADKIEKMASILDEHEEIDVLTSNYEIFYESNSVEKRYDQTAKKMVNDGRTIPSIFTERWPYVLRPGCTYGFRREFFESIKSYWDVGFPHDAILWRYAIVKGSLANYCYPTIRFRRHSDNASGIRSFNIQERINEVDYYISFYKAMADYAKSLSRKKEEETICRGIHWLNVRKEMLYHRKILLIPLMMTKYISYYSSLKSVLADLIILLRANDFCQIHHA